MAKNVAYIVLSGAVSLYIDGAEYAIDKTHPNYGSIIDALNKQDYSNLENLVDIPKTIAQASSGKVEVVGNEIRYAGKPVYSYLATKIIELLQQGFNISPWINFMDKLYNNPSYQSIQELYPFLEKGKLPICPDGDFLAYKYVRRDYKDCHSGKFDNSVGKKPEMPRNQVDDNRSVTCSRGLHFCSKEYLPSYGNDTNYRVMIVKVNPANVVSIPADHNDQKARCWTYEVVGELDEDYSIQDMETSVVLPAPRDNKEMNSNGARAVKSIEDRVVKYWVKHRAECIDPNCPISVRAVAKALKVTNGEVVAQAGGKYYIKGSKTTALSDHLVVVRSKYRK